MGILILEYINQKPCDDSSRHVTWILSRLIWVEKILVLANSLVSIGYSFRLKGDTCFKSIQIGMCFTVILPVLVKNGLCSKLGKLMHVLMYYVWSHTVVSKHI